MLCAGVAQAEADVLLRPTQLSRRATESVMLAVTRADRRLIGGGERGTILYSDDAGATWRQAQVPVSVSITSLHFPTARLGWAVGHSGVILHSSDAGETWVKQLDGHQVGALVLKAAQHAAADSGVSEAAQRQLAEAQRLVADGPDKPLLDVHFFDAQRGLVVGAYGLILATDDAGKSWSSLQRRLSNPKGKHLYHIEAAGHGVYIAGEQGALYYAHDAQAHFEEVKTPYAGTFFGVLAGRGEHAKEINVFGLRGNAYWSADGKTWTKSETGAPNTLTAGLRLADGAIAVVDEAGRILLSRDGGANFKPLPITKPTPLTGIVQAADGSLVVAGVRGLTRIAASEQNR